jgi:hypothetical protein
VWLALIQGRSVPDHTPVQVASHRFRLIADLLLPSLRNAYTSMARKAPKLKMKMPILCKISTHDNEAEEQSISIVQTKQK